jgi:hypothetical protein
MAARGTRVAIDQLLVCPLLYLPVFYGFKMWANGECSLREAPRRVKEKMLGGGAEAEARAGAGAGEAGGQDTGRMGLGTMTILALWAYWVPFQAINFWVVPRHLTIPFMNLLGLGWNTIMSVLNGATPVSGPEANAGAAAAAGDAGVEAVEVPGGGGEITAMAAAGAAATELGEEQRLCLTVATGDAAAVRLDRTSSPGAEMRTMGYQDRLNLEDAHCLRALAFASSAWVSVPAAVQP